MGLILFHGLLMWEVKNLTAFSRDGNTLRLREGQGERDGLSVEAICYCAVELNTRNITATRQETAYFLDNRS